MKKFLSLLALSLLIVLIPATPANAVDCGLICGRLNHVKDGYYDPAIPIECDNADLSRHLVHEYQSSTDYCWDVRRVRVRDGEEIWCDGPYLWSDNRKMFDATGWHEFDNGIYDCTVRKD